MQRGRRPPAVSDRGAAAPAASPDDETAFRAAHQVMAADGFTFGLGLEPAMPWSTYRSTLAGHRTGMNLRADLVPQTLLVADVGEKSSAGRRSGTS
jgi:hypothetical protein